MMGRCDVCRVVCGVVRVRLPECNVVAICAECCTRLRVYDFAEPCSVCGADVGYASDLTGYRVLTPRGHTVICEECWDARDGDDCQCAECGVRGHGHHDDMGRCPYCDEWLCEWCEPGHCAECFHAIEGEIGRYLQPEVRG